jgi:hypothetical protein
MHESETALDHESPYAVSPTKIQTKISPRQLQEMPSFDTISQTGSDSAERYKRKRNLKDPKLVYEKLGS